MGGRNKFRSKWDCSVNLYTRGTGREDAKELNWEALAPILSLLKGHENSTTPPPRQKKKKATSCSKKSFTNYTMISDIVYSFSGLVGFVAEISSPSS